MPKTPDDLFAFLDELGIAVTTVRHPPLFTVADSQSLRGEIAGGHTKNLFLKDKKGSFFMVTVEEDAVVDLKSIHTVIGASGRVSFGKPDMLLELLGVVPGAVTVFGAINDSEGRVQIVLDEHLMRADDDQRASADQRGDDINRPGGSGDLPQGDRPRTAYLESRVVIATLERKGAMSKGQMRADESWQVTTPWKGWK